MIALLPIHSMAAAARHAELLAQAERDRRVAVAAGSRPAFARTLRRALASLAAAGLVSLALAGGAAAHEGHEGLNDGAGAFDGNGGVALAAPFGGPVLLGHANGGGNAGAGIAVGDVTDGSVAVDGGDVSSETVLDVSAGGGVGLAAASGGDGNVAIDIDCDDPDRDRVGCDDRD